MRRHPGGFPHYRHWPLERTVNPSVNLRIAPLRWWKSVSGGLWFCLLANSGAVSGAGSGFLDTPEGDMNVIVACIGIPSAIWLLDCPP